MLDTAKRHFDDDIARSRALLGHATPMGDSTLKDDILRAAWMIAVGACDAYFSDAYADLIARTLQAKDLQPNVSIPSRLDNLRLPVNAIIRQARGGWRWRMAARELIENENVLSLERIKQLFNHFFRKTHKIITQETVETWILHPDAKQRLFGISKSGYRRLTGNAKGQAKKDALERFQSSFDAIFQRRHVCIHNCDRPKIALQRIDAGTVKKRIEDVTYLVERCHEALIAEFPVYLRDLGFIGATRNRVCV